MLSSFQSPYIIGTGILRVSSEIEAYGTGEVGSNDQDGRRIDTYVSDIRLAD